MLVALTLIASTLAHAQTAGGLTAIVESGVEGPVIVIDLVKFKPDGEERYNQYDAIAKTKVISLGGEYVFRGFAREIPGIESKWDRLTMRKYPNAKAVMEMGSSTEYRSAFPHRMASVSESFVYAFSGELPAVLGSDASDPMRPIAPPKSADAVYMLNLLRFQDDGGEMRYYREYGANVMPMITERDGGPEINLKGIGAVIANEEIDRLILVRYPSVASFREMISSDAYQKIAHLRTESIELGLLFPFTHQLIENE
jgi:uncharacterized protein (DUF1330 family)